MTLPAEKLAQVDSLGLSISGLWWTPERIAYFDIKRKHWVTLKHPLYQLTPQVKESQYLAVSPVDTKGMCYFIAFDVDSGNPQDARSVLEVMPREIIPFVSASGKKGWHMWVFPSEPLPVETAIAFAKAIQERAGIPCEIFPSSRRSRCLKWLLSVHPETGRPEVFVREDDLTSEYDTQVILEGLAGGMWRTPATVIEKYVFEYGWGYRSVQETKQKTAAKSTRPPAAAACVTATELAAQQRIILPDGTNLAAIPEIALGLAQLCGRHITRIGQAFRCILPGHQERRPSSAFCYGDNGTIVYHCFHHEKHGTPEFLTLAEVYAAVATGQIRKLSRVEASKWLCRLALRLGFQTQAVVTTKEKLTALVSILVGLGLVNQLVDLYSPVGCKAKGPVGFKAKKIKASEDSVLERVWRVFCEEALISTLAGFKEVKLSKRFLAEQAGVPADMANRAINLLAVLGVVEKVPGSGGMKGDRFTLGNVDVEEARRRLNALFPNGKIDLRQFKASLVAERLGEETAKAIFRRQAETVKGTVTQTVTQTVSETVSQTVKSLLAEIQAAEAVGDWERVKHLQRLLLEEVRKSKGRPAEILWSSHGIPSQYLRNTFAIP